MALLQNLSVGKRLTLAFAIVTLLLLLLGSVALSRLNSVGAVLTALAEDRVPKIIKAEELNKNFLNVAIAARSAVLMLDAPDQVKEQLAKIASAREGNNKALDYLEKNTGSREGKELLSDIKAKISIFRTTQDRMIALVQERNAPEARAFLMKDFRERQHEVGQALEKYVGYQNALMEKADRDATALVERTQEIILGVMVAAVLLSIFIARTIATSVTRPLGEAVALAERISAGDLSEGPSLRIFTDEVGRLLSRLLKMRNDLRATIGDVVTSARDVAGYADQLSSSAGQVSSSIQSQASATSAAAAAVEELTVSIETVSANASDVSGKAAESGRKAESGGSHVKEATESILSVSGGVEGAAKDITALAEKVQSVDQVAEVIKGIAEQTNLLALNAAIEAARAGEQGRGFAVVADEVRKLAERTTHSVLEITSMTSAIKAGAETAVASMQATSRDVVTVVSRAEGASQSMTEICSATQAVEFATNEITSALTEQRTAATDLSRNIESIAQMSEENSAAATAVADTAAKMSATSKLLMGSVDRFRL